MQPTRWRIFAIWVLVNVVLSTLGAVVSAWLFMERADFVDNVTSIWYIGPLAGLVVPTTWIGFICLGIALYKRRYWPLWIVAMCALLFGLIWPPWFTGFMGI